MVYKVVNTTIQLQGLRISSQVVRKKLLLTSSFSMERNNTQRNFGAIANKHYLLLHRWKFHHQLMEL